MLAAGGGGAVSCGVGVFGLLGVCGTPGLLAGGTGSAFAGAAGTGIASEAVDLGAWTSGCALFDGLAEAAAGATGVGVGVFGASGVALSGTATGGAA